MPKVSEEYRNQRRTQILEAALFCFSRYGYHATSMKQICEKADLSPGAIYNYFSGKEELLKALIDWGSRDRAEKLTKGTDAPVINLLEGLRESGIEAARLDVSFWAAALKDESIAARIREVFESTSLLMESQKPIFGRVLLSLLIGFEVQWAMDPSLDIGDYLDQCRRLWVRNS